MSVNAAAMRGPLGLSAVLLLVDVVRNRPARPLANCSPVSQTIASSFIVACQIKFRNKIPTVGVLRRPVLITTFGDGAVRN
jgi:hypothetical protein